MGLVWRCLFALVFLFRGGKCSSVLVVSSWSLRFRVNGWIVICLLCIEAQVRMTECLIVFVKLWGASSQLILSLSFFVGDFNCHHSEWLGSRITDAHGVAAFDFATVADSSQLVNGPTHRAGGVLDLVLTNVPDLCNVHIHGNVGRSDHASLGVALNLSPAVAGFDVARRVPLKSRVN